MQPKTDDDVLERVRMKLLDYVDEAAEGARRSRRAVSLAAYFVRRRNRLDVARGVLHQLRHREEHEYFGRELERVYIARHNAFEDSPTPSAMVRAWMDVLLEATEKVASDQRDARTYAEVFAETQNEDREWWAAGAQAAGDHWTES